MAIDSESAFDATQEAFERAFVRWRRLRNKPWAAGWVMTTATNLCRRDAKRSDRETLHEMAESSTANSPGGQRLDVLNALKRLPFRQRQATVLYYWGDFSTAAIATLMKVSEGAVRAHLTHARKTLRGHLKVSDV